jgi:hypothetical protein
MQDVFRLCGLYALCGESCLPAEPLPPNSLAARLAPTDNIQGNTRDNVEKYNGNFVKQYPGKVYGVKLLNRQVKPCTRESVHPVMREHEVEPPPQQ